MKTEPTDIDREAAALFVPAPGMRVFMTRARWLETGRIIVSDDAEHWVVCESNVNVLPSSRPDALDADDPATVGCMLAQVEKAANGRAELLWEWGSDRIDFVTRWQYIGGTTFERRGPTRGAALVAAMRALKADPTR